MLRLAAIIVPCVAGLSLAHAHHSASVHFDLGTMIEIENATLTNVRTINPHLKIHFTVTDADGRTVEKVAEGSDVCRASIALAAASTCSSPATS